MPLLKTSTCAARLFASLLRFGSLKCRQRAHSFRLLGVVVLWALAQLGLPGVLLHPERGLLEQLALLDIKSAGIFVAILLGICLVLAAIEYMEYKYQKIEKL